MRKHTFIDSQGRPVFDLEVTGHDEDAYITRAVYDDGSPVPDNELDYLTTAYADYVADEAFENAVMGAEYAFEGDR